jgi:TfoX/Sxy family transcriptional regulator of competence genes
MASSLEFVQYVCGQLSDAGVITCKRIFGEFGLYCDGKFFATVEDDRFCLKITDGGRMLLPEAETIEPHAGAKFLYVENLDDKTLMAELVRRTCAELPAPKARRKRKPAEEGSEP